jgi:hypothetical protein
MLRPAPGRFKARASSSVGGCNSGTLSAVPGDGGQPQAPDMFVDTVPDRDARQVGHREETQFGFRGVC